MGSSPLLTEHQQDQLSELVRIRLKIHDKEMQLESLKLNGFTFATGAMQTEVNLRQNQLDRAISEADDAVKVAFETCLDLFAELHSVATQMHYRMGKERSALNEQRDSLLEKIAAFLRD